MLNKNFQKHELKFHTKEFWDNFYRNRNKDNRNIDWYFDIIKHPISGFSLKELSKEDEILLIGPGLSSILDYLDSNGFTTVTIFDFSEELKSILRERYNKEWEIESFDITKLNSSFLNEFSKIIDKGCLDCILSDTINGENNFVKALKNLVISLEEKDGILYYFSDGKLDDRISLFNKVPNIKYKVTIIDTNSIMKEEYKEFNYNDNIYYLYTITKTK